MTYLKNWRDIQPQVYHLSAVVWGGWFQQEDEGEEEEASPQVLSGFARHALQGRKTSDYHKHENMEQVYYVLSGRGEVLYEDTRFAVEEGDAVYLPSGTHHQMFNDEEDWLEHHVISMKVESDGGEFAIRNWRQVAPQGDGSGAMRWRQLGSEGEEGVGFLRGMSAIEREALQPRGETGERCHEELEQFYWVLEKSGTLQLDGRERPITEGDLIHIPAGATYKVHNPHEEWLSYLIIAV